MHADILSSITFVITECFLTLLRELNFDPAESPVWLAFCHSANFKKEETVLQKKKHYVCCVLSFSNISLHCPSCLVDCVLLSNFLLKHSLADCPHAVMCNETQVYVVLAIYPVCAGT